MAIKGCTTRRALFVGAAALMVTPALPKASKASLLREEMDALIKRGKELCAIRTELNAIKARMSPRLPQA